MNVNFYFNKMDYRSILIILIYLAKWNTFDTPADMNDTYSESYNVNVQSMIQPSRFYMPRG